MIHPNCSNNFQLSEIISYLSETRVRAKMTLPGSKEGRGRSNSGLIWLFTLAGKGFVHPASCDKEVKMCTG